MDFVDIPGASGASYRFRRWPQVGRHPPIAGNYVLLQAGTREVLAVGLTDDLSEARRRLGALGEGVELYTRLNISRAPREAEHADISARYPQAAESSAAA